MSGCQLSFIPGAAYKGELASSVDWEALAQVSILPMLLLKARWVQVERSQSLIPPRIPASLSTKVTSGPRSNSILVELPPPM